jgi:hypothetical protein
MRSNPDDLDVFASEEVTELFGWPVTLLDEIRKLDVLARRGEVDIWEWRRRDQELRALGPTRYPRDRIKATYDAALDECCVRKRGGGEGLDRMGAWPRGLRQRFAVRQMTTNCTENWPRSTC